MFASEESMQSLDTAKPQTSIEDILQEAIDELRKDENTDMDLLDILVKYIVVESPSDTAVANAVEQIETLATERAEGN